MTDLLARLYPEHLDTLSSRAETALARGGFDQLVIASGELSYHFLDDRSYPFSVNPHFKAWLPVTNAPGSWIVFAPDRRPKLIYLQPRDYWHVVPEAPAGYWVEHFDVSIVRTREEAAALLPKNAARCAILGEPNCAIGDFAPNNPAVVLDYLHYHRAFKTAYEIAMMRVASRIGARAHRAAEHAFRNGQSEYGIHMAYLCAVHETESELPYTNIVALNEHGAVLHYTDLNRAPPAHANSFLIDAGASFHGYACDITRTYANAPEFAALVDSVDRAQQGFCAKVRAGQDYRDLHVHAHLVLAGVLREHGFIRLSPESALETGVSSAFYPHGLGHMIGLQVHDVGGFMKNEQNESIPKPDAHPYLRLTRKLAPGMVTTIEPGLYFIDMLLAEIRDKPVAKDVDWAKVEAFRKFGGVRIEDDVVCTGAEPENLTREAFAQLA